MPSRGMVKVGLMVTLSNNGDGRRILSFSLRRKANVVSVHRSQIPFGNFLEACERGITGNSRYFDGRTIRTALGPRSHHIRIVSERIGTHQKRTGYRIRTALGSH